MNENKEKKKIEIVNGDGKNLNISPVYEHIKHPSSNKPKNIVVPKNNNNQ